MAILDRIYALRQRPTYELRINGVLIIPDQPTSLDGRPAVYSMRGGERYDEDSRIASPPYLDIEVSRIPRWMRKGMAVTLDAGYDGEHVRVFTGGIWALGEEDPDYLRTQCIGTGATAADGTRIERTASLIGGPAVWPPIPSGQYIDFGIDNHLSWTNAKMEEIVARELTRRVRIPRRPNDSKEQQTIHCKGDLYGAMRDFKIPERDLSGDTVQASIEGILDDAGIGSRNISVGAFTLASEGATLDRMPGAGMLTPLLMLQGAGIRQLPSGLVIARVLDEQPAPTAAFTYSTTDQDYARIISADPPVLRVPFNPLAQIWQTIALALDYLGVDGRFWLTGHDWEIGPGGAFSYLDLRGGDEFGGTVGINPVASLVYSVALQAIGTELFYVITIIPTSTDPDGSIDTSQRTWTTNQTTIPPLSDFDGVDGPATVRIAADDIVGDFEVTLHEEDDDGLSDDFPGVLDLSASSSAVTVPPFFVAAGTKRYATPDGAQTKNTTTPSSKTATAVGARLADGVNSGHAVYGHSNGSLDLTLDANKSIAAALAAVSPATSFTDVKWDWRDHRFVWALTDDCRLYVSIDYGVSFFLLHNLRTVTYGGFGGTTAAALGNDIGLPAGGGVYIHGGDGVGRPLIIYNVSPFGGAGNVWIRVTHLGDLLTDLATPADATMRVTAASAPGYRGDTYILSWASGGVGTLAAIYHTNDPPGPARSFTRATGLTAGLKNGRVMMESGPLSPRSRIAQFGDDDTWVSDDGIAWVQVANNLPSGYTPNHGLFVSSTLGGMANIYEHIIAVENAAGDGGVMKSTDEGDTWNFILGPSTMAGWDTGAKAKKLAIGAPFQQSAGASRIAALTISASPRTFTKLQDTASWTALVAATGITDNEPELFCLDEDVYFATNASGNSDDVTGDASRSTDGGATWAANLTKGFGFAKSASGRYWAFKRNNPSSVWTQTTIYYSDDQGANWTSSVVIGSGASAEAYRGIRIACHPTNKNIVAVWGTEAGNADGFVARTVDEGANWTTTSNNGIPLEDQVGAAYAHHLTILPNGRFVVATTTGATTRAIYTSDDNGVTWTQRYTITAAGVLFVGLGFSGAKVIAVRQATNDSRPLVSYDSGTTWAILAINPMQTDIGPLGSSSRGGAYDPATDASYYCLTGGNDATHRMAKLQPTTDEGVWYNITLNIGSGSFGDANLSVIPA